MNISGIYQIRSKFKPERVYIGSAKNISKRWECHLRELRKNKHHSKQLQYHFNKYGESDLQFSILLGCNKEDLLKTEQYFLDFYNPFFNTYKTAGSPKGYTHTKETLKKISEAQMGKKNPNYGKKFSDEHRRKISEGRKGIIISEETRRKISLSGKGIKKPHSEEHKKKISEANKGRKNSEETRNKISESMKGKNIWSKGRPCSEDTKQKLREYATGRSHPNKPHFPSEETKKKMSIARTNYYKNIKELSNINFN